MKVERRRVLWITAVVVAATTTGCSSSGTTSATNPPAGAPAAVNATAHSAAAAPAGSGTKSKSTGAKNGCPDAASVSAAAGIQLSTPQVTNQSGTLLCSYPSGTGVLAVSREGDAEYSPDTAKSALQDQAQALGLSADSVKTVNGLGDAAYEFTQDGSTTLGIVSGTAYIAVIGAPSAAAAKAVAEVFIG